ncbi:response regulator [Fibrella arboris]|uniref:response regulator n=1 Tax=Fibrella arboris TaxID=3242486 RepID=UPI003521333D
MTARFPVLIIDDDPTIAEIINRAAATAFPEASFMAVNHFDQAVTYLDNLEGRGPCLILLDVDLQEDRTGLDFLTLLRKHPQGRLIPVIMLSAGADQPTIDEAYFRGANAFTTKPFTLSEWKHYTTQLQQYWYQVVTMPQP